MKLRFPVAAAIACTAVLLAACSQHSEPQTATTTASKENYLGTGSLKAADGTPVNESIYRYYVENVVKKAPEELSEKERKTVLESLVDLKLLADTAQTNGLPKERTIAVELALQRMQLLARALINRYLQQHPASDSEIQAAYKERLPSLSATQYKARHILLKTEDDAKAVIVDLKKGANFADLAKKKSTDPTASSGGELGWFTSASVVKPFSDAVKNMKVGTYTTTPVHTQYGWHVILLEDRKEDQPPTLDAVRDQITNVVNQKKIEEYIKSLRAARPARAGSNKE
ncbi:MAG TPA: peptidylprolyl isomerase [Bryobacteraceae bacterium]|nr:peptidylprolyl isomerase [Bryobacteraceae bacterium]